MTTGRAFLQRQARRPLLRRGPLANIGLEAGLYYTSYNNAGTARATGMEGGIGGGAHPDTAPADHASVPKETPHGHADGDRGAERRTTGAERCR
jgi:hypothetical protein